MNFVKKLVISYHSKIEFDMCKIQAIDQLHFDNFVWSFKIQNTLCKLTNGAFSNEGFQPFLYSEERDSKNPYILFGNGCLQESAKESDERQNYCILLKKVNEKKQAFLVNMNDFMKEFIPLTA